VFQKGDHLYQEALVQKIVDALLGSIGKVRKGPADIGDDVLLLVLYQNFDESWDSSSHQLVLWLRPSSTKIGKSPGSISHETGSWLSLVKNFSDTIKCSTSKYAISC